MITVNFGTFSKRKNSTKRPDLSGFTSFSCALKDGTSEDAPVFIVNAAAFSYTYAEWSGRYYWITGVEYTRNSLFTVSCAIDVLATYKTDIAGSAAFVLYSSGANAEIPDDRLPQNTTPTVSAATSVMRSDIYTPGSYILSCVGKNGSVSAFRVARSTLTGLLDDLDDWWHDNIWEDMDDETGGESMVMAFLNGFNNFARWINAAFNAIYRLFASGSATDAIRSLTWVPFDVPETGGTTLYLGDYDTGKIGFPVSNDPADETVTVSIPWQFSDWRNGSKCTQVYLYIPFIGVVSYPAENLKGYGSLSIHSSLQRTTGDITVQVSAGSEVLGTYGASTGASVPIGTSNVSLPQIANGMVAAAEAGTMISSGNIAGFGALAGMLRSFTPNVSCIGGLGNSSAVGLPITVQCITVCHNTVQEPSAVSAIMGTPTFRAETIPASGYCQTLNYSFPGSCMDGERQQINSLLDGGIYLE